MAGEEEYFSRIEREAVYRVREICFGGREASLEAASPKEEDFVRELAERALYPEKPLLSFERRQKEEEAENVWLPGKEDMEFFRLAEKFRAKRQVRKLIVCGGVDDGKSTLIGRVLFDVKSEREREEICGNPSYLRKDGSVDFALLAGASEEETRQGITVQVSYSAFDWDGAGFLMADVPGHEEYARNMAFAASGADLAVIMIAANKGIVPQTRRHARICRFMGIKTMVFAVNKMDMVSYDEKVFLQIREEIDRMMAEYENCAYRIVPVAAKSGVNIKKAAEEMPWYQDGALLDAWKEIGAQETDDKGYFCMPVQRSCKSSQMKGAVVKKRVIQGEVISGSIGVGDEVYVYPTARRARVSGIYCLDKSAAQAYKGDPIGIELDGELDASRGYILSGGDVLTLADRVEADILWTSDNRLTQGKRYRVKIGTAMTTAVVTKICYQTDVNTGEHRYCEHLTKNAMARCELCFPRQIALSLEKESRILGAFCLLERKVDSLAAYGNIVQTISEEAWKEDGKAVLAEERESALGQKAGLIFMEPGEMAGEFANYMERRLLRMGFHTIQASFKENEVHKTACIRGFLDAGLIVLVLAQKEEKEALCGLLEEKSRIFDCGKTSKDANHMGMALKRVKNWASELI